MRGQLDEPRADARVAMLAARQHGLVTYMQLFATGLSKGAIHRRIRAGHIHRVHRGVYAVGHSRLTREGRYLAAVLAYGIGAALSHVCAAVHLRLLQYRSPRIDITVPGGGGRARRRGALIVHRSPLPEQHVTTKHAIPVTTPARTIIDLADYGRRRLVERSIDEAHFLRLDLSGLEPIPGRRGAGLLASILEDHDPGSTGTRNDFEETMYEVCRLGSLPRPLVNHEIEGYEVDFVWVAERLIVETDGWQAHGTRRAFEADRIRDAELTAVGWRVVRITWRRLEREPHAVAAQLARLLAA
jgi:very-short-patch-repair endonuclease